MEGKLDGNDHDWTGRGYLFLLWITAVLFLALTSKTFSLLTVSKGICFEARVPVLVWMRIRRVEVW